MLARCMRDFRDLDAGVLRTKGDEFEVTEGRFKTLNSTRYGKLVTEVERVAEEEKATPKRRAPRRKAAQED